MPIGAQERAFRAALLLLQRFGYHAEGQLVARLWVERFPASEAARHLAGAARGARCKRASPSFLIEHFDDYAERFDRHVVDELGYRVPEALGALLGGTLPARQDLDVLDAGCGTGLCAPWLRPIARHLVGVDLSPNMLERARGRRLYDALVEGDLVAVLARAPAAWDVVIAADVLIYLGDLAPLVTALAGALRESGRFAFSIEDLAGDRDWDLKPGGRFAHSSSYVRRVFGRRFNEARRMEIGLRKEGGTYVHGKLFVLQKR
jgi:predicted TPR repeat methyltransferase